MLFRSNPNTTAYKCAIFDTNAYDTTASGYNRAWGSSFFGVVNPMTGFQIGTLSGVGFQSGSVRVYGYK